MKKVNYTIGDFFEFYRNKILINWVKDNHPEIIEKAEKFIKLELSNKD